MLREAHSSCVEEHAARVQRKALEIHEVLVKGGLRPKLQQGEVMSMEQGEKALEKVRKSVTQLQEDVKEREET